MRPGTYRAAPGAGFHAPIAAPAGSDYARQLKPLLQPGVHKLIGFARRSQGLIVRAGNPLALQGVADLARPGLRFVARQPGSGTWLLTDALLRGAGVDPATLALASGMEDSHLAVAAAAFGLGFVPLAQERYAFVCLKPALEHPAVRALQALLAGPAWATQLAAMPGYAADQPGRVLRLTEALPWWDEIVGAPRRRAAAAR